MFEKGHALDADAMGSRATASGDYSAANHALWEEWAAINYRSANYDVAGFKAGGSRLRPYEVEEVGDVAGKDLLHLQCHFGLDTLSWARLGARVTGADFSERAIAYARGLAAELGLAASFVHSDILALPDCLEGDFDVVYTSRGVIGWLPDVDRWARVVAHFLRPGGTFYITEIHPFALVFDDREGATELRVHYPYFPGGPPVEIPVHGSYADPTAHVEQPVQYWWAHSLGEIVTALSSAGLTLDFLHEWPFLAWELPFLETHPGGNWRLPAGTPGEVPLSFSLKATRVSSWPI